MPLLHMDVTNLDTIKKELIQYHDSESYMSQIAAVDAEAKKYIIVRVAQNNHLSQPKKLAVVFDIDETSLSNYPDMLKMNFGGSRQEVTNAVAKGKDPVIQPTLSLFQLAEKDHVAVFFITGRPETLRSPTVKNLDAAGYSDYSGLYMRPDNYKNTSIIPFKSSQRKLIESKGYDIILTLGDQQSDLAGGFDDRKFKLPNPFYYLA